MCSFCRTETSEASRRTIEEFSLELLPQTSKRYVQNFLIEANQQFATDNLYLSAVFITHPAKLSDKS